MSIASPIQADPSERAEALEALEALEAALRASEARFRLLVSQVSDYAIVLLDALGRVQSWNVGAERLNGHTAAEILGAHLSRFYPETPRTLGLADALLEVASLYGRSEDEGWRLRRDGSCFWAHMSITALRDDDGHLVGFAEVTRDLTDRRDAERRLEESEARFRGVLEAVRSAAVTVDLHGQVTFANDALCALTGWSRDELVGADWLACCVPEENGARDMAHALFAAAVAGAHALPSHYEQEIVTRDGTRRLVAWDTTMLRDMSGVIVGAASLGRDVTAQKASEEALRAQAHLDELTGVYNRRGFVLAAERKWRRLTRGASAQSALLACIDLDRFKQINDTYGHAEGDQALRTVGEVLRAAFGSESVIGRLGGDEFAVLIVPAGVLEIDVAERMIREWIARHLTAANHAGRAAGRLYDISLSAGVARAADESVSLTTLMVEADERLYEHKRRIQRAG